MKILIKNGRIWDGEQFFFADVLTENDKIAQIADHIEEKANFVFDATGMTVSAGLVDAHAHIAGPERDAFSINGEMSELPFGVTAAADAGGAHGDKALSQTYLLKNVTFVTAPIRENKPVFTGTEKKLEKYGETAIGIKVYFDTRSCDVRDITPLAEICRYAHERNLKVMVHCSHSPTTMAEIVQTLGPGDILTHAFHGAEHTAAEDGFASLRAAKKRGVIIDAGFAGHCHTDFDVFCQAVGLGVLPDTISTDITTASAYMRGGRYGMTACMSIARTAGMTEEEIFRAVTTTPAKILGKAGQWGSLQVGGCADIAVLAYTDEGFSYTNPSGSCFADTKGYRCKLTVANGTVVWRD